MLDFFDFLDLITLIFNEKGKNLPIFGNFLPFLGNFQDFLHTFLYSPKYIYEKWLSVVQLDLLNQNLRMIKPL